MLKRYILYPLFVVLNAVASQKISPCPHVLSYVPRIVTPQTNRWLAKITLDTKEDLQGFWMKIVLDKKADLLGVGNHFGSVTSSDNQEYLIKNDKYVLSKGVTVTIEIFVKYRIGFEPNIKTIFLDGKLICALPNQSTLATLPTKFETSTRPFVQQTTTKFGFTTTIRTKSWGSTVCHDSKYDEEGDVQCGTIGKIPIPLVLGGQNTTNGQYPWHVAIYRYNDVNQVYTCGGSLISKQHVLTAAHCVYNPSARKFYEHNNFIVYLGKYELKHLGCETQERSVSAVVGHVDYNSRTLHNDIAILRLSRKVILTDYVKPICLCDENQDLNALEGATGTVVGWGYSINKELSNRLMQATMPIVPMNKCTRGGVSYDKALCAGFANGTSICNGDSGGGLVLPKKGTSGSNTIWQIRGVGSFSRDVNGVCDPLKHVVFVDVAKYLPWIRDAMKQNAIYAF